MVLFVGIRAALAAVPAVALRWPIKKWAALAALLGALGYLILTGATVPTQRAFMMTALVALAVVADRWAISMRLVALAATVILLLRPGKPSLGQFPDVLRRRGRAGRRLRGLRAGARRLATRRRAGAADRDLCRRRRLDDGDRLARDRSLRRLPFQPDRPLRPAGQSFHGSGDGQLDHALGGARLCRPAARLNGMGVRRGAGDRARWLACTVPRRRSPPSLCCWWRSAAFGCVFGADAGDYAGCWRSPWG